MGFLLSDGKSECRRKRVPKCLWDFGLVVESEILTQMVRGQDLCTGYEEVTVQTDDISEWLDFEFYELVYWYDQPNKSDVSNDVRRHIWIIWPIIPVYQVIKLKV